MPIPNDYKDIINTLYDATSDGRVKWSTDNFTFGVSIQGSRFKIWGGTDEDTERDFVAFALVGQDGKTLDNWYLDEGDNDFNYMHKLLLGAKRYALGIPQRLASIRDAIGKTEVIGDDNDGPF